ncbi:hypothetical protein B0181_05605 [Moraxella caviae]|uniref:tRNA pseudouridine synthase D n=1 Tax=Moraxella caviae TaxID=34060 RepID=A0A1T0A2L5_9GAMM|nr:tRNA pseudouridine(13) synthase TruD [Moraxella caviae]OOR89888.1 hypothetical protein B0181_05605 [Moraxella caviae]STZ14273.1 tRNA pseudouridine synthase D [Moraxella caviae]
MTHFAKPQPTPAVISHAVIKSTPQDFLVTENFEFTPTNQGEHLWLYVQKTGLNTQYVAKLLAAWANIPVRDVGFSGLKDRHAITRQWFSLRIPTGALPECNFVDFLNNKNSENPDSGTTNRLNDGESLQVLRQCWHNKKLGRGSHRSNRFGITLRCIQHNYSNDASAKSIIDGRLHRLKNTGVPNYFGEQRFGNDGANIAKAEQFFAKLIAIDKPYKPHKKDRERHALYISAARSALFNAMLGERVRLGVWDKAMAGDVFNLNGTGSLFTDPSADLAELNARIESNDIHPTAVLFGTGESLASQDCAQLENSIISQECFATLTKGLLKVGVKSARRPTRLLLQDLTWQWQDDSTLFMEFTLPKGSFATVVIDAICENAAVGNDG